jgi:hypothetical protein
MYVSDKKYLMITFYSLSNVVSMFVHINIYLTRVKILIHLKIDENEKRTKISVKHIWNVCVRQKDKVHIFLVILFNILTNSNCSVKNLLDTCILYMSDGYSHLFHRLKKLEKKLWEHVRITVGHIQNVCVRQKDKIHLFSVILFNISTNSNCSVKNLLDTCILYMSDGYSHLFYRLKKLGKKVLRTCENNRWTHTKRMCLTGFWNFYYL